MAFCFVHAAVEATGACDDCKKPICTKCTKGTLDGFMCPPCAHKRYGRRKLVTGLKVAGIVAVITSVGVFGLIGSTPDPPKPKAAPTGEQDVYVVALREKRDLAPCNQEAVRTLVKELIKLGRHADAVDDGNAYFAKCGPFPRLEWDLVHALQQLGRYTEAVKHETNLIERDPYDSDFWWWRGEDRARSNEVHAALADYRQSFATSEDAGGSRFPAARILDVAGPADQTCEGVFALDFFVEVHDGELGSDLAHRVRGLDTSAQCQAARGRGSFGFPAGRDQVVEVLINDVEGSFLIEEQCGTTALSTAFAQLVQVAPGSGPRIQTIAAGAIRTGAPARADLRVGSATAAATEIVIVDGLPSGIDGVLGLSFFWRFHLARRDDGGLTISDERP